MSAAADTNERGGTASNRGQAITATELEALASLGMNAYSQKNKIHAEALKGQLEALRTALQKTYEVHRSSLDAMLPVYNTAVQMEGQKKGIAAAVDAAGQHARAAMHLRGRLDAMEAQLAALTAARRAQGAAVEEGSKGSSLRGMIEAQPFVDRRSHG